MSIKPITVIGSYLSPYVRKVLVTLNLKNIPYQIDPIIPFFGNDEFGKISPIRRIPVLMDDQVTLSDSSVICQYLEERYPTPSLYPQDIAQRAKARWLEEYADTRMGDVFIWHFYFQKMMPFVWGKPTDELIIEKAVKEEIPAILDYLESEISLSGYFFEELSIADISVAAFFRNAYFAKYKMDETRWPRTAAFVQKVLQLDCFEKLRIFEEKCLRTPIAKHREALLQLGAPLTAETYGTDKPRKSIMMD